MDLKKRPKSKCLFKSFETQPEYKVFEAVEDPFLARCKVCPNATINVTYKGRTALDIHLHTVKHRNHQDQKDPHLEGETLEITSSSCRVCLRTCPPDSQSISLHTKALERHGGILIEDGLATAAVICTPCLRNLELCEAFYSQCQKSSQIIRNDSIKINGCTEIKIENEMAPLGLENQDDTQEEFEYNLKPQISPLEEAEYNNLSTDEQELSSPEFGFDNGHEPEEDVLNTESLTIKKEKLPRVERKLKHKENQPSTSKKTSSISMCEICGNSFKSARLYCHMRRHNNIKPHICEICSKAFTTSSELGRHMRVHTGERPFACHYCDRRFADKSTHTKHERTHTGERPFVCDKCGKSFTYSEGIRKHMVIHTGEKNFVCQPCNKAFSRPHLLKQHEATQIHKNIVNDLSQRSLVQKTEMCAISEQIIVDDGIDLIKMT